MTNVMIDLETLGTKPGCVVLALGACKFGGGVIQSEFYRRIDAQSCCDLGMTIDAETVMWWMKQDEEARAEMAKEGLDVSLALIDFINWLGTVVGPPDDVLIWGNGASFDNVILSDACDRAGVLRPWGRFNDRCYRTVKAMFPEKKMERTGPKHHALEDAKHQALHLMQMMEIP